MAYKSQQAPGTTSMSDLMQMFSAFGEMGRAEQARLGNKRDMLVTQLDSANTSQEIENLSKLISSYDKDVKTMGYEEYALGGSLEDKKEAYQRTDKAYVEAESILQKNLGDKDALYDEIMGMTWEQTTNEINDLNNIIDGINTGTKYKHNYK